MIFVSPLGGKRRRLNQEFEKQTNKRKNGSAMGLGSGRYASLTKVEK